MYKNNIFVPILFKTFAVILILTQFINFSDNWYNIILIGQVFIYVCYNVNGTNMVLYLSDYNRHCWRKINKEHRVKMNRGKACKWVVKQKKCKFFLLPIPPNSRSFWVNSMYVSVLIFPQFLCRTPKCYKKEKNSY